MAPAILSRTVAFFRNLCYKRNIFEPASGHDLKGVPYGRK